MLTSNKAVYGTDGSLSELGKLKGSQPTPIESVVNWIPNYDIESIDIYFGDENDITFEHMPYYLMIYITAWLKGSDDLKIAHVLYNISPNQDPHINRDSDGEYLTIDTTAGTSDVDINLAGNNGYSIYYYEIKVLHKS